MNNLAIIAPIVAIIALVFAYGLASWINKVDEGTERMKEIAGYIREGSMAFLKREYKTMVVVILVLFLLIGFAVGWITAGLYSWEPYSQYLRDFSECVWLLKEMCELPMRPWKAA